MFKDEVGSIYWIRGREWGWDLYFESMFRMVLKTRLGDILCSSLMMA
jgi:hypothetical protein